jgi:hypothetical protein
MSLPDRVPAEVELRLALVLGRYGGRLDAEQTEALRRAVEAIVDQVTSLRAVLLGNADEPLPRFIPFRGDE